RRGDFKSGLPRCSAIGSTVRSATGKAPRARVVPGAGRGIVADGDFSECCAIIAREHRLDGPGRWRNTAQQSHEIVVVAGTRLPTRGDARTNHREESADHW